MDQSKLLIIVLVAWNRVLVDSQTASSDITSTMTLELTSQQGQGQSTSLQPDSSLTTDHSADLTTSSTTTSGQSESTTSATTTSALHSDFTTSTYLSTQMHDDVSMTTGDTSPSTQSVTADSGASDTVQSLTSTVDSTTTSSQSTTTTQHDVTTVSHAEVTTTGESSTTTLSTTTLIPGESTTTQPTVSTDFTSPESTTTTTTPPIIHTLTFTESTSTSTDASTTTTTSARPRTTITTAAKTTTSLPVNYFTTTSRPSPTRNINNTTSVNQLSTDKSTTTTNQAAAIALGVVFGALFVIGAVSVSVWCYVRWRKKEAQRHATEGLRDNGGHGWPPPPSHNPNGNGRIVRSKGIELSSAQPPADDGYEQSYGTRNERRRSSDDSDTEEHEERPIKTNNRTQSAKYRVTGHNGALTDATPDVARVNGVNRPRNDPATNPFVTKNASNNNVVTFGQSDGEDLSAAVPRGSAILPNYKRAPPPKRAGGVPRRESATDLDEDDREVANVIF